MTRRELILSLMLVLAICLAANAQTTPWNIWTFLPEEQMDEIIGEASGETAWNTIMETGGYNKDRLPSEYADTFYESQYILDQLKLYGLPGARIDRFPPGASFFSSGKLWDGIKGELWEISPNKQKLASYQDLRAMLASGSKSADVKAELVWIGSGTKDEIERADVAGKIVVTEGSISDVHRIACQEMGAEGVVAISTSNEHFDSLQIPWRGLRSWRRQQSDKPNKFGFYLTARYGALLKRRLLSGEKITVHAQVETTEQEYTLQCPVCYIPGTDPNAGEVILTAHLFEGYVKQGANDNKSGSAAILEAARVLYKLIEEGRLPQPKRTIRFLWVPEFSGTIPWVNNNLDIVEKLLCNINLDMVGEWLTLNKDHMVLHRTTYGNPHYINDVMENYYRFIADGNMVRAQNRGLLKRIVAPSGADEPFYYSIETHSGGSDHEVFNDWGIQVPGILMIAWPDQWYHTSGDRVDKADPTQMKRAVIIAAAGAFTVANADDVMAIKIAGETSSNATRRLGHQLVRGLELLNKADSETLAEAYKSAQAYLRAALDNEMDTLSSVLELASNKEMVGDYLTKMLNSVKTISDTHLSSLETHMKAVAVNLNTQPVQVTMTDLEEEASRIVYKPTARVTLKGYGGYREFIDNVPQAEKDKYPYSRMNIANTGELQRLVNGKRSALDIKFALDTQYQRKSDLQAVMNYLEILKLAGLVEE